MHARRGVRKDIREIGAIGRTDASAFASIRPSAWAAATVGAGQGHELLRDGFKRRSAAPSHRDFDRRQCFGQVARFDLVALERPRSVGEVGQDGDTCAATRLRAASTDCVRIATNGRTPALRHAPCAASAISSTTRRTKRSPARSATATRFASARGCPIGNQTR